MNKRIFLILVIVFIAVVLAMSGTKTNWDYEHRIIQNGNVHFCDHITHKSFGVECHRGDVTVTILNQNQNSVRIDGQDYE